MTDMKSAPALELPSTTEVLPSNDESIIDVIQVAKKNKIETTDLVLCILDIGFNNKKYKYCCSNNTKSFWENVKEQNIFKIIFKGFAPETLRKYWKLIREGGSKDRYIYIVRNYSGIINNNNVKLQTIIKCITSYLNIVEEDTKFLEFFCEYIKIGTDEVGIKDKNNNDN